ncbi:MAG: hypothetical protein LBG80_14430 [Bacteroidales bacterium]|jgi:hypothetical protein|nr:hypothetical protein [Bacteroidales bacterium]
MSKNYIPRPDGAFLNWVTDFLTNLRVIADQINFPREVLDNLDVVLQKYTDAYKVSQNPATRTKVSIQAKTDARKILEKDIRQIVGEYLVKNHLMTNTNREMLGLPIPKTTRTPVAVAAEYPSMETDTSVSKQVSIYFFPLGGKRFDAKLDGQNAVETVWAISDTPIVDTENLTNSAIDTRSPFTITFQGHERGKMVYFALRWLNTRGEPGPWSNIFNVVIP